MIKSSRIYWIKVHRRMCAKVTKSEKWLKNKEDNNRAQALLNSSVVARSKSNRGWEPLYHRCWQNDRDIPWSIVITYQESANSFSRANSFHASQSLLRNGIANHTHLEKPRVTDLSFRLIGRPIAQKSTRYRGIIEFVDRKREGGKENSTLEPSIFPGRAIKKLLSRPNPSAPWLFRSSV